MNDVIINVSNDTATVDCKIKYLGNQHQNLQNKLKFKFEGEVIEGIAWLEYEIDNVKKYALMERYEEGYQIDIKSCLLISDYVNVDLKITQEENPNGIPIFVSNIKLFEVKKTINATEKEPPEEYPNWKDVISSKLAEFENAEKVRNENEEARKTNESARNKSAKDIEKYITDLKEDVVNGELNGATFIPSVSAEGDLSFTNDKGLENPETVNIRGPQGLTGDCNFATFEINEDMELVMNKTKDDMLLDFAINNDGELEVVIK